jgi:hypothetical protein
MKEKNKKKFSLILRGVILTLLFIFLMKGVAFLVILIALSIGLSFIINNFPIRDIGLELVTFIAVLSGLKYGPWVALGITFALIMYHMVAGGFMGNYILWVIPAYCLTALVSGFLPQADVTQLGIYATIAINANNLIFTGITNPGYVPRYMIYVTTNLLFNIFLFTFFGHAMLLLIR